MITSQKDMVHVHRHGTLNLPAQCPIQGQYRRTGHPNIVVFEPMEGPTAPEADFAPIDTRQVNIPNMVTLKVEWALYQTSKQFRIGT